MAVHLTKAQIASFGISLPAPSDPAKNRRKRSDRRVSPPQEKLWQIVSLSWPHRAVAEYKGAVPGRRFAIDIAFPEEKLAIEVDGWEFHGKHLASFKQDRLRQNLLTVHGWRILRFFPEQIFSDTRSIVETISMALD